MTRRVANKRRKQGP